MRGENGLEGNDTEAVLPSSRAWMPYVAPMVAFAVVNLIEGQAPKLYFWLYTFKAILVTVLLLQGWKTWKQDVRPDGKMFALGTVIGLAAFAIWILVDPLTPHFKFLGSRVEYNPFHEIHDPTVRTLFLLVRFYGLVLLVPLMEELFWRSFLLRYITEPEFEKLPLGTFSWGAFAMVAAGFGLIHPEWLVAVLFAAMMGLLLRQTRSLFACIVAHAVTNLALGLFVLLTHNWKYW